MGWEDTHPDSDKRKWDEGELEKLAYEIAKVAAEEVLDEFYFKNVKPLEEQLKALGKKPKKANPHTFYPKRKGKFEYDSESVSWYHSFIYSLWEVLVAEELILEKDQEVFLHSFDGVGNPENSNLCKWQGQTNLCTYLIDLLIDNKIILDIRRDAAVSAIFGIKNPAQVRQAYCRNQNQKPNKHQSIDMVFETAVNKTEEVYKWLNSRKLEE